MNCLARGVSWKVFLMPARCGNSLASLPYMLAGMMQFVLAGKLQAAPCVTGEAPATNVLAATMQAVLESYGLNHGP